MATTINYQNLLENALKTVVRDALLFAQVRGLGDGNHFYITFKTRFSGVQIPDFLRMRYPEEMTIVLQHSFANLTVNEHDFGVTLTFDGRPFFIRVPYAALLEFKDPSVDFMLQFHPIELQDAGNDLELPLPRDATETGDDRIVSLDAFRQKKGQ